MKFIVKGIGGLLALLVVLALHNGSANAASQTWSPVNTKATFSASSVSFTTPGGFIATTCPTSKIVITTAASAVSSMTTAAANVTYAGGCTATGGATVVIVTSGTWGLTLSDATTVGSGGGATATCGKAAPNDSCAVTFHIGGMVWTYTFGLFGSCTVTYGAQSLAGTYTDTNTSIVFNDNTVSFVSSGGACGASAVTANFTGTYTSTVLTVTSV